MSSPGILRVAYVANIFILVPVCFGLLFGDGVTSVFDGKVAESAGLRLMVASLWTAILVASIVGLFRPAAVALVVLVQILYKTMWLGTFVLPKVLSHQSNQIPTGISVTFALIVLTYPFLYLAAR